MTALVEAICEKRRQTGYRFYPWRIGLFVPTVEGDIRASLGEKRGVEKKHFNKLHNSLLGNRKEERVASKNAI